MVNQIYPPELQLNEANTSDTEAPFLDLHLSISNGFVSSKIYDKRDDFNFDIVNFSFLDGDVPRRPSYGVYISQLIRFARVCSHADDFNTRNNCFTAKLLKQGYRYHELRTRPSSPVRQVRRAPDHFFGRICYPPYHFFAVSAASVVLTCDLIPSNHQKCRVLLIRSRTIDQKDPD